MQKIHGCEKKCQPNAILDIRFRYAIKLPITLTIHKMHVVYPLKISATSGQYLFKLS